MKISKIVIVLIATLMLASVAVAECAIQSLGTPNGGESWTGTNSVMWTYVNPAECALVSVDLYQSADGGANWALFGSGAPSAITFSWDTTTTADGAQYLVRVQEQDGLQSQDSSDAVFTIDNSPPNIAESDISLDTSGCTGTGGTCKIGDAVIVLVDTHGDNSISAITFTDAAVGDVLNDLTHVVDTDFNDANNGPDVSAGDGIWTASFTIDDSTVTGVAVDTVAYPIEVTLTDIATNTQTQTSVTHTLDVDNEKPALAENVVTVNNVLCTGTAGTCKLSDVVNVFVDVSGLDAAVNPVDYSGTSATDVGAVNQVFVDDGTGNDAGAIDGTWSSQVTANAGSVDDSVYGFVAIITDDAGNVQTLQAATSTISIDNEAPILTEPSIAINGGSGTVGAYIIGDLVTATWDSSATGDNNPDMSIISVDFSEFEGVASGAVDDGSACADTALDNVWTACHTLVAGAIDIATADVSITVTDDAGNTAGPITDATDATVDNIAPIIAGAGTITVTAEPVLVDGVAAIGEEITYVVGSVSVADGDLWDVDLSTYGLGATEAPGAIVIVADDDDGALTATETVTDDAGNTVTGAATTGFDIDNEAPAISVAGTLAVSTENVGIANAAVGDGITYTAGTESTGDTILWTVDLSTIALGAAIAPGAEQLVVADDDDDSAMTYTETVTDNAGNAITGTTGSLDIDNQIPVITDGGNVAISLDGSVISVAGINDGVTVDQLTYNGGTDSTGDTMTWTVDFVSVLGYGGTPGVATPVLLQSGVTDNALQTFSVVATDDAGNAVSGTSNAVSIDDIAPIITGAGTITVTAEPVLADGVAAIGEEITYVAGTEGTGDSVQWFANLSEYELSSAQSPGAVTIISGDDENEAFAAFETIIDDAGNTVTGAAATGFDIDNQLPVFIATSSDKATYSVGEYVYVFSDMVQMNPEISTLVADLSVLDSSFSATQTLYDDGSNEDVVAGDATFTYRTAALNQNTMSGDGTYVIVFTATDDAGNVNTNNTLQIGIIKDKPTVHGLAVAGNPTAGQPVFVTANLVDDTAVTGAKYSIYADTSVPVVTDAVVALPEDDVWGGTTETVEIDITADIVGQPDGVYYIDVYAQDANAYGDYQRQTFTIANYSGSGYYTTAEVDAMIDDLNASIQDNTQDIGDLFGDVNQLNTSIQDVENDVDDVMQRMDDAEDDLDELFDITDDLNQSIILLDDRVLTVEDDVTVLDDMMHILEVNVSDNTEQIAIINGHIQALYANDTALSSRIDSLNTTIDGMHTDIGNLQTSVGNLQTDLNSVNGSLITLRGEFDSFVLRVNAYFDWTLTDNTNDVWAVNGAGVLNVISSRASSCTYTDLLNSSSTGIMATGDSLTHTQNLVIDDLSYFKVRCVDNVELFSKELYIFVEPEDDHSLEGFTKTVQLRTRLFGFLLARSEYETNPSLGADYSVANMMSSVDDWNSVAEFDFTSNSWESYVEGVGGTLSDFSASMGYYVIELDGLAEQQTWSVN